LVLFILFGLDLSTGSRNPAAVAGEAAGFALCWTGNPNINIGYTPADKEVVQVVSDNMLLTIPEYVLFPLDYTTLINYSPKVSKLQRVIIGLSRTMHL
jgi:hypothetical protein